MPTAATLLLALLGTASAHMEVQFPPPLMSKFNPNTPSGQADYNMISPLNADGSNFPCKGYQSLLGTPGGAPTASFAVGGQGNMTITGGANHNGGSCQISLSTDGAKTFTVIQSIVGNCPTSGTSNLDFTVPPDAPAGDAVMAWTWHNQIGNREMYMNCAAVTLTGGGGGGAKRRRRASDHDHHRRRHHQHDRRAGMAFSARPGIYIANVGAAGDGCKTQETFDVQYPDPGPDVVSQSQKAKQPDCGVTQKVGSGGGAAPAPAPAPAPGGGSGGSGAGSGASSSASSSAAATPATPTTLSTATSSAAPSSTAGSGSGSGSGSGAGAGLGSAPSSAAPAPSSTGSAAGAGAAGAANAPGSACAQEGAWACLGSSFQRCASGQWSIVMQMAPGTTCSGGTSDELNMVAATT